MSLLNWLHRQLASKAEHSEQLEKRIEQLEQKLQQITDQYQHASPIKVEHLHIDRAIFERVEYHSNIGHLDVAELSGKLNIGANYFGPLPAHVTDALANKMTAAAHRSAASASKVPSLKINGQRASGPVNK